MTDTGERKPATDLFDQWLAHREQRAPEAAPDVLLPEATPEPPEPTPEQPAPAPEPVVQPPVAPEPGFPPLPVPEERAATSTPPGQRRRPSHLAATDPAAVTGLPDHLVAAASVLAALQPDPALPPESITSAESAASRGAGDTGDAGEPPAGNATAEEPLAVDESTAARGVPDQAPAIPHTIFFKPRSGGKLVLGLMLLIFLALTALAAVWAWSDRTYLSYGVTAVAALVTAVIWGTRASSAPARLTLHGSELEIVRNGSRALFDLASTHTPIEMYGEPGDRKWKVLFRRRSMSPYVVDSSMVDPTEFTRVLRHFRPEV